MKKTYLVPEIRQTPIKNDQSICLSQPENYFDSNDKPAPEGWDQ